MRVLEINGFMRFAQNYEGTHEVERWSTRSGESQRGVSERLSERRRVFSRASENPPDVIVCHAFGMNYGDRRGGKLIGLRHFAKARLEKELIRSVAKLKALTGAKLAVVDIADDQTIHPVNVDLLKEADLYFKRELPLDGYHFFDSIRQSPARAGTLLDRKQESWNTWLKKLRPLSLGCASLEPGPDWVVGSAGKKWDVFYVGNDLYRPRRDGILESLKVLKEAGVRVRIPENSLSIEEYLKEMAASWLAISPPGLGWDCHRHYEASLLETVPVTPFPTIQRYQPLLNDEHCLFYDPEKDLVAQVKEMLVDSKRLEEIGKNAREYSEKYHTFEQLFEHVTSSAASV